MERSPVKMVLAKGKTPFKSLSAFSKTDFRATLMGYQKTDKTTFFRIKAAIPNFNLGGY